jgi:hypothetical protein
MLLYKRIPGKNPLFSAPISLNMKGKIKAR